MQLADTLPEGYAERYGVAKSCDTRSFTEGVAMAKTAIETFNEKHQVVLDSVITNEDRLSGHSVTHKSAILSVVWLSAIHLRLCEQTEATARTNELLEQLVEKMGVTGG